MSVARPIFIVGSGRCGTTLLAQILERHPDISVLYELESLAIWLRQLGRSWPLDPSFFQLDTDNIRTATELDDGYNWRISASDAMELQRRLRREAKGTNPATAIRRWADGYHHAQLKRPGDVLIHKTPALAMVLPELCTIFPECRIVHIQRHPCAVIASYLQKSWGPTTVDEGIAWYLDRAGAAFSWAQQRPEICHQISYEGLVEAPAGTLSKLLNWLDIPDNEQILAGVDITADRIHDWKSHLTPQDVETVNRRISAIPDFAAVWTF